MANPKNNKLNAENEALRKRVNIAYIIIALLVVALCTVTIVLNNRSAQLPAAETPAALPSGETVETAEPESDPLSLWTDEAKLKTELTDYIKAITDPENPDFIPEEYRIAVFDMDGTILNETDPVYMDHRLLLHRVVDDPDYKDKASDFEKEVAADIQSWIETGKSPKDLLVRHGQAVASAFAGFTVQEFYDYADTFKALPMPSYEGMTNGQAFYKPMLQVIDYLNENGFKCYIVSGTDRLISRAMVNGAVNIPARQVIGSDESLVATGQGDTPSLDYTYQDTDQLVLEGVFLVKNLKMNKVDVIAQEIGVQPVLAFGNSSGDFAMATYTTSNNKYKALGFMVCCDDLERENGNLDKAESMVKSCEEHGWTPVSMKNDWTTIYGEGVTYKGK